MATIDEFKANLIGGGARANQFRVTFTTPGAIATGLDIAKASFLIKAAALPGQSIPEIEVPFRGRIMHIAGDRTFEDWTVSIINDVNFTTRTAVEQWMESIQELDSGVGATDLDYLVSRATVSQLNRDDSILATYELYNMYPSTLNQIDLSFDTADEIQTFDITFSYSHWERTL